MSRIPEAHNRLQGHWSALRDQWRATREVWRDDVGDRFEREFWQEWEAVVPLALNAFEELEQVLDQAEMHTR